MLLNQTTYMLFRSFYSNVHPITYSHLLNYTLS